MNRGLKYSIAESFPAARWGLCAIAAAFSAVVGVYKYIELSDMAAAGFSSLEITWLIFNDIINVVFIYLPLYLFIICGVISGESCGDIRIIRTGGRKAWLVSKFLCILINTAAFMALIFAINFFAASRAFYHSFSWSSGFVSLNVMSGYSALDFAYPPAATVGGSLVYMFAFYLFCGTAGMFVAVLRDREDISLLVSLILGIGAGLLSNYFPQKDALSQLLRFGAAGLLCAAFFALSLFAALRKDFIRRN